MPTLRRSLLLVLMCLGLMVSFNAFATRQNEKLWLGLMVQRPFAADSKWQYMLFAQSRFINEESYWQSNLIEGAIGRSIGTHSTIWLGYRFTEMWPTTGFLLDNRLFQQVVTQLGQSDKILWIYRARLEETQRQFQSQISVRFRHRLAAGGLQPLFLRFVPMVWEEAFFQMNKTSYMSNEFINENRLFIGGNWLYQDKGWLEVGYINQYQMRSPTQTQNIISHILSLTYYF